LYEYDAFGNERNPEKGDENPFRYCGEYLDLETNTYYLRARSYNPVIGRFLSEDQIRSGENWYIYANNNPIKFIDPDGLDAYVFYLKEWLGEAKDDRKRLMKDLGLSEAQVHLTEINSKTDLKKAWDKMGKENGNAVSIDAVVINTHANPTALEGKDANGKWWSFDISMINNLHSKDVGEGGMILYGCNAGHIDYKNSNVANAFAKKTKGAPVLAADGTVRSGGKILGLFGERTYTPLNEKQFKRLRGIANPGSTRDNQGWTVYQFDIDNKQTSVSGGKGKKLTLTEMLGILKENYIVMRIDT